MASLCFDWQDTRPKGGKTFALPCAVQNQPTLFQLLRRGCISSSIKVKQLDIIITKTLKIWVEEQKTLSWFSRKTSNRPPSNQVQCRFQVVTRSSNSPFLPLVSPWKGDTLLYTSCKTLAEGHIRKTHKKGDIYFFWKMRDMNWKFCTNLIEPLPRNTSWQLCTNPGKSPGRANDFVGFRFQRKVGGGR